MPESDKPTPRDKAHRDHKLVYPGRDWPGIKESRERAWSKRSGTVHKRMATPEERARFGLAPLPGDDSSEA